MTKPLSVGGAEESSPNISQSRTPLNALDAKQSISISEKLQTLISNPNQFNRAECYVGQVLDKLEREASELLKIALNDKRIRHMDLLRLCAEYGFKMSEATMRRHRAFGCRCPR